MKRSNCHLPAVFAVVVGLLGFVDQVFAEPVKIAVPEITTLLEENGSGIYQKIFQHASVGINVETKLVFLPYKRALTAFDEPAIDCVFSFTKVLQEKYGEDNILYSFPFGAFGYYMFTRKDDGVLIDVKDLHGKRVGGTVGHDSYYQHRLPEGIDLTSVRSDKQSIDMLKMGRLDAIIAAVPDISPFLKDLNYSAEHPLVFSYDRLTCKNTPENKQFLNLLSAKLSKLKLEGVYKEIAGDYYLNFNESYSSYPEY